jgi:uncharacterized OsmC-like protein
MTSKIVYLGNLRTEAEHLKSGNKIVTDAPIDNQGKGEAFSPTDLVATALGSCMATIMGIRARDHNLDIEGTEINIEKIMASEPRRIEKVNISIRMPSNDYSDSDKELLEETARGCPLCNSLIPGIAKLSIDW